MAALNTVLQVTVAGGFAATLSAQGRSNSGEDWQASGISFSGGSSGGGGSASIAGWAPTGPNTAAVGIDQLTMTIPKVSSLPTLDGDLSDWDQANILEQTPFWPYNHPDEQGNRKSTIKFLSLL